MMNSTCFSSVLIAVFLSLSSAAASAQPKGTMQRIADTKTITLGYRLDAVPFSYLTPDGVPAGYVVDLCRRVIASLQQQMRLPALTQRWVPVTSADRVQKVVDGEVDLECGTTSITLGRMAQVDFSSPIYVDGSTFLSLHGGSRRLSDMAGKRIGVLKGSTTEVRLREVLARRAIAAQIIQLGDERNAVQALVAGEIDALANDRLTLIGRIMLAQPEGATFSLAEEVFSLEPYALMMRHDVAMRAAVNRALARVYASPAIDELYRTWLGKFGEPSPLLVSMFVLNAFDE